MQNLFIEEDDVIEIKFSVATDKEGAIFCDVDRKKLEKGLKNINADLSEYEIEDYVANFKKPSFGDLGELYNSVFSTNDGRNISFNPISARFRKIILLIKEWNFTGEMKKPTEREVRMLNPVVASVLGNELDKNTGDFSL